AAEEDGAGDDVRRRPQDLHHRVRDRALAAARLAGEPDDLSRMDLEVDPVDRADAAFAVSVLDDELAELDERVARPPRRRSRRHRLDGADHDTVPPGRASSRRSRRRRSVRSRGFETSSIPASSNVSPSTVMPIARPGKRKTHHSPWSTLDVVLA